MRRILLLSAAAVLVLSGCGGGDAEGATGDLDDVTVSAGASPDVTVSKDFSVDTTTSKVLTKGTGAEVVAGDSIKVNYVAVNGRTGKQFDSSFTAGTPYTVSLTEGKILPGFIKGLEGRPLGSRVLVAISPKDGFGQAQAQLDVEKDDTLVFLFDVVAKVPTEATGAAKKLPSDVPDVVLDAQQRPDGFAKNSKAEKNPTTASSHTAIEGTGPAVAAGQTVTVNYVGARYPGGEVFESSWRNGEPITRPLAELIPCWQTQLEGATVGSRVVLVCPKSTAYEGTDNELKDEDLIFAVDVLDAY